MTGTQPVRATTPASTHDLPPLLHTQPEGLQHCSRQAEGGSCADEGLEAAVAAAVELVEHLTIDVEAAARLPAAPPIGAEHHRAAAIPAEGDAEEGADCESADEHADADDGGDEGGGDEEAVTVAPAGTGASAGAALAGVAAAVAGAAVALLRVQPTAGAHVGLVDGGGGRGGGVRRMRGGEGNGEEGEGKKETGQGTTAAGRASA